jgi:large subunit ribosomal protein L29
MKISELREKTDIELDRMLAEHRNKVRDLRFKVAARQLTDVREIRETRKAIAQILTLRRSRRKA